jgi:hypothetical protein
MDYKYIEQLLESYWQGQTTLQEEAILRSFFSQTNLPQELRKYQPLFTYEKEEPLGDDFDARILNIIGDEPKAKTISFTSRLMPLFKAAAIVAIILTLVNAAQAPWNYGWDNPKDEYARYHLRQQSDSVSLLNPVQAEAVSDSATAPKSEPAQYLE